MKIFFLSFLTLLLFTACHGQRVDKVYLNEFDSTSNRYLAVVPEEIKGYLFLIPSFYESPEQVMIQSDIPTTAAKNGILTIIPTFKTGLASFGIDSVTQLSFKEILEDVNRRYKLKTSNFYLGGFSIGGSCAVKFAEEAVKNNYSHQAKAVFVVDPPLDFIRFYNSYKRTLRIAPNSKLREEALYILERM